MTPKSGQLMPAQRPTDACGARGRQICSQQSLHLPSTGALLSPRALTRSRCGGDELGLHAGPVRARTAALQGRMPRARAHAAARIDGAECTRALQVRRRWRRRIAPRDATGAECGASACGLTPRRRPRRRRRRRRKLLVLDTVVMRRCRVRFCVPRRWGRAFGRVGAQVRCPRRLARLRFKRPSHARSAERGARRRRLSDAQSAERGAPERRAERGARCAAGFRVHPLLLLLLLLQARLRFKRPSHARSAERGARRRRLSDARAYRRLSASDGSSTRS